MSPQIITVVGRSEKEGRALSSHTPCLAAGANAQKQPTPATGALPTPTLFPLHWSRVWLVPHPARKEH